MIPRWRALLAADDERLAAITARVEAVPAGPWVVWDGPDFTGGGRDLCIGGPGRTWLANMDHRRCVRDEEHTRHYFEKSCAREPITDICTIDTEITEEQVATARFIAHARDDVPYLLGIIAKLRAAGATPAGRNVVNRGGA